MKYNYEISGWYIANGERKHFDVEIQAESNTQAMEIVIGRLAWEEGLKGNSFLLDMIHYEVLR